MKKTRIILEKANATIQLFYRSTPGKSHSILQIFKIEGGLLTSLQSPEGAKLITFKRLYIYFQQFIPLIPVKPLAHLCTTPPDLWDVMI